MSSDSFKRNKRVYLANPYSCRTDNEDYNGLIRTVRKAVESYMGGVLKKKYGVTLILPIAQSESMANICAFGTGFGEWAQDDFTYIEGCDELWVLLEDGWEESIGVQAEIKFALDHNKPVKYVDLLDASLLDAPTTAWVLPDAIK